jgi:hypothetical protein
MFTVPDHYQSATANWILRCAEVERIARLTVVRRRYLDLVKVWVRFSERDGQDRWLNSDQWRYVQALCPGAYPEDLRKPKKNEQPSAYWPRRFGLEIVLPQPAVDVMLYLHGALGPQNYRCVHAQFALDLCTANQADANIIRDLIEPLWLLPRRPKGTRPKVYKNSRYAAQKTRRTTRKLEDGSTEVRYRVVRTNHDVYSDKGCPVDGGRPCCHLQVLKTGWTGIGDLVTLAQTEHDAFWNDALSLRAIDHAVLARAFRKAMTGALAPRGPRTVEDRRREEITGMTLAASAAVEQSNDWHCAPFHHVDTVNSFLRNLERPCRVDRVFMPIDGSAILRAEKSRAGVDA